MDQFVEWRLKQVVGGEKLIPLFRNTGIDQEAYRNLSLGKLMGLLPQPEDEELVLAIRNDVKSLSLAVQFPSPIVVVKTEPQSFNVDTDNNIEDDEVEVIDTVVRAPSGFIRVEIKQEQELIEEPTVSAASPVARQECSSDPTDVITHLGPDSSVSNDASCSEHESRQTLRRSHRIRKMSMNRNGCTSPYSKPSLKLRRLVCVHVSHRSCWNQFKNAFRRYGFITATTTTSKDIQVIGQKLEFQYSIATQLNDVVEFLEEHVGQLATFLKSIKFNMGIRSTEAISNLQISRLLALRGPFWSRLTSLEFDFGFPEVTDFELLSRILGKCNNLQNFEVCRGITGLPGLEVKTLHVPEMNNLVNFRFAVCYTLASIEYVAAPSTIDVDIYNGRVATPTARLLIDFGSLVFPKLCTLQVGPFIDLRRVDMTNQFPKLDCLAPGNQLGFKRWMSKDNKAIQSLTRVCLPVGTSNCIIELLPLSFPNLTQVSLSMPTFMSLRSLIIILGSSQSHIAYLLLAVNFDFESALPTALKGLPYKLITDNDRAKLHKVKKYPHWKEFLKYLKIEVPTEELQDMDDNGDEVDIKVQTTIGDNNGTVSIGSFKHLKWLEISNLSSIVCLPEGGLHWADPNVRVSTERWCTDRLQFPNCVLLEELTKLKGTLIDVNLPHFDVDPQAAARFQEIMGFSLRFDADKLDETSDDYQNVDLKFCRKGNNGAEVDSFNIKEEGD